LNNRARNLRLAIALGVAAVAVYILYVVVHAMSAP